MGPKPNANRWYMEGYRDALSSLRDDPTDAMIQRGVDALRAEPDATDEARAGVVWAWMLLECTNASRFCAIGEAPVAQAVNSNAEFPIETVTVREADHG
jgi:hypothetical protein